MTQPPDVWPRALATTIAAQPYPLLFVTVSGAHLYGFPSRDSDFDLRGVHVVPLRDVVGLCPVQETIQSSAVHDSPRDTGNESAHRAEAQRFEVDLVTHDAGKFFRLLLKRNGYVLEQLCSPLVLHTTPAHAELVRIAQGCVTRQHAHHYLGFARTQWNLFERDRGLKPLLYVYRVLLTGIHLMRTGTVQANLVTLNRAFRLPYIEELLDKKIRGAERDRLDDAECAVHEHEYVRLTRRLENARDRSHLPDEPAGHDALHDLLVRIRLEGCV